LSSLPWVRNRYGAADRTTGSLRKLTSGTKAQPIFEALGGTGELVPLPFSFARTGMAGCDKGEGRPRDSRQDAGATKCQHSLLFSPLAVRLRFLCPTELVIPADAGGHYSRVQALSRIGVVAAAAAAVVAAVCLALPELAAASVGARAAGGPQAAQERQGSGGSSAAADPGEVFAEGQVALGRGDLDGAERNFRQVLALDPKAAAAYANLGVISMRRKQWEAALTDLKKAEKLAPQMTGIRLNIGLAYYRQNDFWHAIPAFESVVKDQPDSAQARTLLGQCYFFTARWVEAVDVLEPAWAQESRDLNYLYVLDIAADRAERNQLRDRALAQLVEVGGDSAEVHMLLGKAKLNEEAYDDAEKELSAAADADPKLPFVHFNLGVLYSKKGNYERARTEFLKDIALEPDVAFNHSELGNVYFLTGNDAEAEKSYRQALQLEPRMLDAHLGLAKVYQREGQLEKGLTELDAAAKLDPQSARLHYLRGQILIRMGRKEEGKKELDTSLRISSARREQRRKELEGEPIPNPELTERGK
jgi:tetratricopeptide (TPR) repeat protein